MVKERAFSQTPMEESKTFLLPQEKLSATATTSGEITVKAPIQSVYTGYWPNRERKTMTNLESLQEPQSPNDFQIKANKSN